ncbi:hypothetical protein BDY24DRAFT_415546 [Mrakia frigida]|uniref:uncharacterized protein n=1 Tax=Mrakia frigida TaxID=29902 RepID=UPI003FCC1643
MPTTTPSFTKLLFRKSSSAASNEKAHTKYDTSPPSYTDKSIHPYQSKSTPQRIVLPAEDPMELYARLSKGQAHGGIRFATLANGRA